MIRLLGSISIMIPVALYLIVNKYEHDKRQKCDEKREEISKLIETELVRITKECVLYTDTLGYVRCANKILTPATKKADELKKEYERDCPKP